MTNPSTPAETGTVRRDEGLDQDAQALIADGLRGLTASQVHVDTPLTRASLAKSIQLAHAGLEGASLRGALVRSFEEHGHTAHLVLSMLPKSTAIDAVHAAIESRELVHLSIDLRACDAAIAEQVLNVLPRLRRTSLGLQAFSLELGQQPNAANEHVVRILELSDLTALGLEATELRDLTLQFLARMPYLRSLDVSSNPQLSAKSFEALEQAEPEHFNELSINNARVDDRIAAGIARVARLRNVQLAYNALSPAGVEAVSQLPRLQTLVLDGNAFGDDTATAFMNLTRVFGLSVRDCGLGGRTIAAIASLPSLRVADFSDNQLGGIAIDAIAKNPALTHVGLANTGSSEQEFDYLRRIRPDLTLRTDAS